MVGREDWERLGQGGMVRKAGGDGAIGAERREWGGVEISGGGRADVQDSEETGQRDRGTEESLCPAGGEE